MHFSILDTLNCQVSILHSEGRKNENLRILLIFRMLGLYVEVLVVSPNSGWPKYYIIGHFLSVPSFESIF